MHDLLKLSAALAPSWHNSGSILPGFLLSHLTTPTEALREFIVPPSEQRQVERKEKGKIKLKEKIWKEKSGRGEELVDTGRYTRQGTDEKGHLVIVPGSGNPRRCLKSTK
jgi:hypothetical protein